MTPLQASLKQVPMLSVLSPNPHSLA
uniref:Putative inactive poly ADP-ribose polymerase SRO3 isoform X2 n=1 Tax=Rhizophora mucronata TaxID=61149 RepID=A0A2P2J1I8_RHIMU